MRGHNHRGRHAAQRDGGPRLGCGVQGSGLHACGRGQLRQDPGASQAVYTGLRGTAAQPQQPEAPQQQPPPHHNSSPSPPTHTPPRPPAQTAPAPSAPGPQSRAAAGCAQSRPCRWRRRCSAWGSRPAGAYGAQPRGAAGTRCPPFCARRGASSPPTRHPPRAARRDAVPLLLACPSARLPRPIPLPGLLPPWLTCELTHTVSRFLSVPSAGMPT